MMSCSAVEAERRSSLCSAVQSMLLTGFRFLNKKLPMNSYKCPADLQNMDIGSLGNQEESVVAELYFTSLFFLPLQKCMQPGYLYGF